MADLGRDALLVFDPEDNIFLAPGPVKIHPRILRAGLRPAFAHRSPEFRDLLRRLTKGLQYLFQTKGSVLAMTGSATLGMEAIVSNIVAPGDRILVLENGKFGERFSDLAHRYAGPGAVILKHEMGQPLDLQRFEAELTKAPTKAVACVLNESSTGMANPGERIGELCRKHDAFFLADGVTAVGGTDVPVDKWNIDACVVGSQKCIGAPPGATLLSFSKEYLEAAQSPSLYMDLKSHAEKWAAEETPFTPATHLYLQCAEALEMLAEETLEARIRRTKTLAQGLRAALTALNIPLLVSAEFASDTITAARYPKGISEKEVRDVLKQEYGIVVAGGQGDLKGRVFRVAHMGYVRARELIALLGCLELALARTTHVYARGSGVAAFNEVRSKSSA